MADRGVYKPRRRNYRRCYSLSFDPKVYNKFGRYCRDEGYTISRVVESLIKGWLKEKGVE